jgi:hypothetical protein
MVGRLVLFSMIAVAHATMAETPAVCPWLAAGTAARVLGEPIVISAHSESNWEGGCSFVRQSSGKMRAIEIQVSKANPHACPDNSTKLNALGNDAVQCRRSTKKDEVSDLITGRVRDAYFVVTMTNLPEAVREPGGSTHPADLYGASGLEQIAEQVAGSLF